MRVLIVDDEPDILLMLRMNLEADGFETALAADGETAIRRMNEEKFDAVLLDVMMPVMDGWGVLQHVQDAEDVPPIIVLSAKSSDRDVARALDLGAAEYVTKPFDVVALPALIERVVARTPAERAARRLESRAQLGGV